MTGPLHRRVEGSLVEKPRLIPEAGDCLGRTPKTRTVTVRLNDGRKITGKIIEAGGEGLRFAPEKNPVILSLKDLKRGYDGKQKAGQTVELTTRSGQSLKGTLQSIREGRLWLYDERNIFPIGRTEIRRVSSRSHWMGALIGLAIGAGAGAIYGAKSAHRPLEGVDLFGFAGAIVGGCIGLNRTIYDNRPVIANGRAGAIP